jgi:chaperonin GroES
MIPIRNQILVKPFDSDNVSAGGIIVPDSCKKVSNKVLVVKTGNGTKEKPMKVKAGDIAYRVFECGCPVEIDWQLHFIMDSEAILAKE